MKAWQNLEDRYKWGEKSPTEQHIQYGYNYLKIQKQAVHMQGRGKEKLKCHSVVPPSSKYVSLLTDTLLPAPLHPPTKQSLLFLEDLVQHPTVTEQLFKQHIIHIVLGAVEESGMNETQLHPSLEKLTFICRDVPSLWLFKYFSINAAGLSLILCLCLSLTLSLEGRGRDPMVFSLFMEYRTHG